MTKSFLRVLTSLFFAISLIIVLGLSEVSAYSTDAETQGIILYVKPGANGTCTSWANACELQTALFNAVAGDQIWVAAGTYKPSSSNRLATFQLKSGVAIYGGFPAAGGGWETRDWETNITTLSGEIGILNDSADNSYHVVTGSGVDETALLDGFTITGGNADGNEWESNGRGGGMYNEIGSPSLSNITFNNNSASYYGGGMCNNISSPSLTNVTFSSNTATSYGGGMYSYSSSPSLNEVTFNSNTADEGGGMYNYSSSPRLANVTFSGNTASDGGGMYNASNSSPTLNIVTYSGNSATNNGGGMYNYISSPSLSNVTFSSNTATNNGGGMYNYISSPSLSNVTFSSNTATNDGGGMYNDNYSNPNLSYVTLSGNSANSGGGMSNSLSSSPSLSNVTFSGNTATNFGGGMHSHWSSAILTNVIFSGNSATLGGGMSNVYQCHPILTNVTFSGNSASNGGGMLNYSEVHVTLTNVTFSSNLASDSGGGMYNYFVITATLTNVTVTGNSAYWGYGGGISGEDMTMTISNSIIWGNTPDQISGTAVVKYSDIQGGHAGIGNIDANPLLGPLNDNGGYTHTHALGDGSPAIDTGNPTNCPNIDQRVYARPIDGDGLGGPRCDMGAYEYASYPAAYALNLDIVGSGSITKDPNKSEYFWGEVVFLTPVADPDWVFIGWSGDASGMDNPLTVAIFEDTNIIANFRIEAATLTTSVFPEGTGDVVVYPDQPKYQYGEQVTLTAIPNPSWYFAGWNGDASGFSSQIVVTMTDNLDITANFSQAEHSLSVLINPPGMGTVTKSPDKPSYHYGETVTLTATGVTGWWLESWGGDASGSWSPLTITVLGNTEIVANFTNTEINYLPVIIR